MTTPQKNNIFQDYLEGKVDRREFIKRALIIGMTASGLESFLAACGGGSSPSSGSSTTTVKYANWASAETATKKQIDQALSLRDAAAARRQV